MGWLSFFNRSKVPCGLYLRNYIDGICAIQRHNDCMNYKYCKGLEKNLEHYKNKSSTTFRETADDDDICVICMMKLIGHCTTFACDCKLTIHQSCLFKFILSGFKSCPQCTMPMTLQTYNTNILYPITLDRSVVLREYDKIWSRRSTPRESLDIVRTNTIKLKFTLPPLHNEESFELYL